MPTDDLEFLKLKAIRDLNFQMGRLERRIQQLESENLYLLKTANR